MGKGSRKRAERRKRLEGDVLRQTLDQLEPGSVIDLLGTALCSPSASHQSPAIALALSIALESKKQRGRKATPQDLAEVVAAAHQVEPALPHLTDVIPLDPRAEVGVRWRCGVYCIIPGAVERPVATVAKAGLVASVIDSTLVSSLGFGLGDVVEVLLRHADAARAALAPHWTTDQAARPADPPEISREELAAYAELPGLENVIGACAAPARARAAVEFLTSTARAIAIDPGATDSVTGSAGRVRTRWSETITLSPALFPEIIDRSTAELSRRALLVDPELESEFAAAAAEYVFNGLQRLDLRIAPQPAVGRGRHIHSLLQFGENTFLALEVLTSLSGTFHRQQLAAADERLQAVQPGTAFEVGPDATGRIPISARVARLLVVVHPQHLAVGGRTPTATLEDLDWILERCRADGDGLYRFCVELEERPGISSIVSFETINIFEHWWNNEQSLHRTGSTYDLMMVDFHRGDAEWLRAAENTGIERSLAHLRLPPLSWWPHHGRDDDGIEVFDRRSGTFWNLPNRSRSVAVGGAFGSVTDRLAERLEAIARAIVWKLEAYTAVHADWASSRAIRIRLTDPTVDSSLDLRSLSPDADELFISISDSALDLLEEDSVSFERTLGEQIGSALLAVLPKFDLGRFVAEWEKAPPGIRIDAFTVPQAIIRPRQPDSPDRSVRSHHRRELARMLAESRVEPGEFTGRAASKLETETIYPALSQMLHVALSGFSPDEVVRAAINHVERAIGDRAHRERSLSSRQRLPVSYADPIRDTQEIVNQGFKDAKIGEIVLEEALSQPGNGQSKIDRMQWREVLAIADLMLESALRSEDAHLGLRPVSVQLSDSYEISVGDNGLEPDFDTDAFIQARTEAAAIGLHAGPIIDKDPPENTGTQPDETMLPAELAPVDNALFGALGFGLNALVGVASELRYWPVSDDDYFAWTMLDDIVTFIRGDREISTDEVERVVSWLTLDTPRLQQAGTLEHWEQERRNVRAATRPIVAKPLGALAVRPWAVEGFLRRLVRYLDDGRLPWPASALPDEVNRALNQLRQKHNATLEVDVFEAVKEIGLLARKGVRKPDQLGLTHMPGEIDVVAACPSHRQIIVIEVKDPYQVFSSAQLRYQLDDFHSDAEGPSYVSKLLAKTEAVAEAPSSVARALGAPDASGYWQVKPLMVTRQAIAASFVRESKVPFTWLDMLRTLDCDGAPHRSG